MAEALALFVTAFAAATILPLSSEVAFIAALTSGMDTSLAMLSASLGNVLAVVVNYSLGFWLYETMHHKLESSRIGAKALYVGHRYGYVALPLTVLPIIGDPLTIVAGMVRLHFVWFLVMAALLRIGRYYLILLAY